MSAPEVHTHDGEWCRACVKHGVDIGMAGGAGAERGRITREVEAYRKELQPDDWYRRGASEEAAGLDAILAIVNREAS